MHQEFLDLNYTILISTSIIMFFIIGAFWDKRKASLINILPALGICGTFIGIVYSLWFIDTNDIQNSIPLLLDGMKIAFLTSILGMGSSIIIKILLEYESPQTEDSETAANISELIQIKKSYSYKNQVIEVDDFEWNKKAIWYGRRGKICKFDSNYLSETPENFEIIRN